MKRIKSGILFTFLILSGTIQTWAQEKADTTAPAVTVLRFDCVSTSDDSIQLSAAISVKHEEGATNLANATVVYYSIEPGGDLKIGASKTDVHGVALLKIPVHNTYARNEQQMLNLKAAYNGNDKFEASEAEFALKPAKLLVSFYEEDSVRYVKVTGTQYDANGTESSIGAMDVIISVPKMFSMLKIAQVTLDSTGVGSAEFPRDIIGDSLGNLTVVASIEENETFGNVKGSANNTWGLPKHLISPDRPTRELWTPIAPLWMIITLIIMLAGVWGHYIYAIIQLVMIGKSAKAIKPEQES
jgi:hypothetical protein